ncbi:MAG: Na(+)-translocating NADH-quinone reductase subunit A [Bacteroidales bacterium]|nr:Na(+)-translocating NADH-quinone reductase subunit A [Bacteroidales bacterium]
MDIKIKKGLDLPLDGAAERQVIDARSIMRYAVKPTDIVGLSPRLVVEEGNNVTAGQPLVCDKNDPRKCLTSPINGTVEQIVRGEKRKLLAVVVKKQPQASHTVAPTMPTDAQQAIQMLIDNGMWWMLRQRPFGTMANPDVLPKGIFISLFDSAPLAPDIPFTLKGREHQFESGINLLGLIAPVHISLNAKTPQANKPFTTMHLANATIHTFEGPHPAGNIGTQIAAISPINKGEVVWTIDAQDVATVGNFMQTGTYAPERIIAVAGPAAKSPHYYHITCGADVSEIVNGQTLSTNYPELVVQSNTRAISGNALCGTTIDNVAFLGTYHNMITMLPEGNHYDFMGWLMPGLKKHSFSRTFLSGFLRPFEKYLPSQPAYDFNTNTHGSVRPFLFTGNFERIFPFEIYPLQLIKACIVGDLELMEQLGIYEVEPEDFALCEYIDPSKTEIQAIVRQALETLRKEATA